MTTYMIYREVLDFEAGAVTRELVTYGERGEMNEMALDMPRERGVYYCVAPLADMETLGVTCR